MDIPFLGGVAQALLQASVSYVFDLLSAFLACALQFQGNRAQELGRVCPATACSPEGVAMWQFFHLGVV